MYHPLEHKKLCIFATECIHVLVILKINSNLYLNNISWSVCLVPCTVVTELLFWKTSSSSDPSQSIWDLGGQTGTGRGFVRELRISSVTIISRIRRTSGRSPRNFKETIPFRKSGIIGRKSIFAFFKDSKQVCLFSDHLQFPITHNYLLTDAVKAKPLKLSKWG